MEYPSGGQRNPKTRHPFPSPCPQPSKPTCPPEYSPPVRRSSISPGSCDRGSSFGKVWFSVCLLIRRIVGGVIFLDWSIDLRFLLRKIVDQAWYCSSFGGIDCMFAIGCIDYQFFFQLIEQLLPILDDLRKVWGKNRLNIRSCSVVFSSTRRNGSCPPSTISPPCASHFVGDRLASFDPALLRLYFLCLLRWELILWCGGIPAIQYFRNS